jgi:hypothetical protein
VRTEQVPAKDVQEDQQLTAIPGETLQRRRGVWPTVTQQSFLEDGEGGHPTVYIETHEKPGWVFCLNPDDPVTVLVSDTDPEPVTGWRSWFPTWPSLIRCIGGAAAMNAWQLLPPGHDLIRWVLPLYVAAWLAYEVWDGWYLRWAIPTIAVVAGLFAGPYVTFAYRALILAAFWAYVAIWIVSLVRDNYRANRDAAEPETRMTELSDVEHEDG